MRPYPSTTFSATGGSPPYSWSLAGTQPPDGLTSPTVTGATDVLSGTPTGNPGIYDFTIQLTDSRGSDGRRRSL